MSKIKNLLSDQDIEATAGDDPEFLAWLDSLDAEDKCNEYIQRNRDEWLEFLATEWYNGSDNE